MVVLGEKLGGGPVDHSAGLGVVREPFFREQYGMSNAVDGLQKVSTYGDCPQKVYVWRTRTGAGSVRVVFIWFSPIRCTSIRIIVTLGYE
jgi:hypothetical protein